MYPVFLWRSLRYWIACEGSVCVAGDCPEMYLETRVDKSGNGVHLL